MALPKHTILGKEKQSILFIVKEKKGFIRLTPGYAATDRNVLVADGRQSAGSLGRAGRLERTGNE